MAATTPNRNRTQQVADEDRIIPPDSPLKAEQATIISQVVRQIDAGLQDASDLEKEAFLTAVVHFADRCAVNHELEIDLSEALDRPDAASDDELDDDGRELGTRGRIDPASDSDGDSDSAEDDEEQARRLELRKLTLSLTPDHDVETMTARRDEFVNLLARVDVSQSAVFLDQQGRLKTYAPRVSTFNDEDIRRIANFLFHDMLGAPAYTRMVNLTKWWNDTVDGDAALAERARLASRQVRYPKAARELFDGWAAAEQSTLRTNNFHRALTGNLGRVRVLQQYLKLVKYGKRNLKGVPEAVQAVGVPMKGRWTSRIKQYIQIVLGLPGQNQLNNRLQEAQMVSSFSSRWGVGVVVLMPVNFISFFRPFGVVKVNAIAKTLQKVLRTEPLMEMCDNLDQHIINAVRNGRPLKVKFTTIRGDNLQSRIENALFETDGDDDAEMVDAEN